ncbi:IclR family transcriptional regulator [Bordetella genomosp. 7]|uniref:IclR family transcriptional regulator n=1 Tax=Bordetella genomosp. 7 TaxID=1416805 RepID=UPI00201635B9|nr:helix-turn-helix domain-containing protein [Bordetella genomosp. 7]
MHDTHPHTDRAMYSAPMPSLAREPASPETAASRRKRAAAGSPAVVEPFARALAVLAAFLPGERWLGTRELAQRCSLPASTVTRMAQTLVALGYLFHDPSARKYRLAPSALTLGYGAMVNSDLQRVAYASMQGFADRHKVHVNLSSRDRLDMIVLESCRSAQSTLALDLHAGVRLGIASSPMGWALLAALPELERYYLLENVERRALRHWPQMRRRTSEGLAQVHRVGYCSSLGEWDSEIGIVAAPLLVEGHAPMVLACVGASQQMTRARVEREIGPQLLAMVAGIQQQVVPQ